MPKLITWNDVLNDPDMVGRDIEFNETVESGIPAHTVRGPIKRVFESQGGTLIEFALQWSAFLVLDAQGSWHVSHEESTIGFSKEETKIEVAQDGTISFDAPHFATGTIYPLGVNLKSSEVKGFGTKSGPLN
jgi:hypothetical protein